MSTPENKGCTCLTRNPISCPVQKHRAEEVKLRRLERHVARLRDEHSTTGGLDKRGSPR